MNKKNIHLTHLLSVLWSINTDSISKKEKKFNHFAYFMQCEMRMVD